MEMKSAFQSLTQLPRILCYIVLILPLLREGIQNILQKVNKESTQGVKPEESLYIIPSYQHYVFSRMDRGKTILFTIIALTLGILYGIFEKNIQNNTFLYEIDITQNDVIYFILFPVTLFLEYFLWQDFRKKRIRELINLGSGDLPTCPRCMRSYSRTKTLCPYCTIPLKTLQKGERIENDLIPVHTGWYGTKVRLQPKIIPFVQEENRVYASVLDIPFVRILIGIFFIFFLLFLLSFAGII